MYGHASNVKWRFWRNRWSDFNLYKNKIIKNNHKKLIKEIRKKLLLLEKIIYIKKEKDKKLKIIIKPLLIKSLKN